MTLAIPLPAMALLSALLLHACTGSPANTDSSKNKSEALQEADCNSPDVNINCCFVYMPANLNHILVMGSGNAPGEKMKLSGTMYKADGKTPLPGVIMYAYQTDHTGRYSRKGNEKGIHRWHGHLHGWCKTDHTGYYEIHTIRPKPYPGNTIPAHIHAALQLSGGNRFYINNFVWKDDPFVTKKYIATQRQPGGTGVVDLLKHADGSWTGQRNIIIPE